MPYYERAFYLFYIFANNTLLLSVCWKLAHNCSLWSQDGIGATYAVSFQSEGAALDIAPLRTLSFLVFTFVCALHYCAL